MSKPAWILAVGCLFVGFTAELTADDGSLATKRELVATVLGKPMYLDQITPSDSAAKRLELVEPDYRRWLRAARAGSLLLNISGRVLKDYEVRMKLSPSDVEIDRLIADTTAKQVGNAATDQPALQRLNLQVFWLRGSSYEWRTAKAHA